jgi:hypothetical protein
MDLRFPISRVKSSARALPPTHEEGLRPVGAAGSPAERCVLFTSSHSHAARRGRKPIERVLERRTPTHPLVNPLSLSSFVSHEGA